MQLAPKFHFRLLLPALFVGLSILLDRLAARDVMALFNGELPPPDNAVSQFVDFAINAPAWVAASIIGERFHIDWTHTWIAGDLWEWLYRLFVLVMWLLIARGLQRWSDRERIGQMAPRAWPKRALDVCYAAYGVFILVTAVRNGLPPEGHSAWFTVAVAAWGVALLFMGVCPLSAAHARNWTFFFGAMGILLGTFEAYWGIRALVSMLSLHFRTYMPGPIVMVAWAVMLILGGSYLLLLLRTQMGRPEARA